MHFYVNINTIVRVLYLCVQLQQTSTRLRLWNFVWKTKALLLMCVFCLHGIYVYVVLCCVPLCRYRCGCFISIRVYIIILCMRSSIAIGLVKKWAIRSFNFKCFMYEILPDCMAFFRCICLKLPPSHIEIIHCVQRSGHDNPQLNLAARLESILLFGENGFR